MEKKKYLFILIAICLVTYFNTFFNSFTAEDFELIYKNNFITSWENTKILFGKGHILSPAPIKNGARPLTLLSFMLDYSLWEFRPLGYHITNLVFHTANCLLLFWLFILLGLGDETALGAASVWALHPIQGEVVNVPGFRGDLLACFFFLLALIFFLKFHIQKKKTMLIPVLIFYILALLSKEIAVMLPGVMLLYYAVFLKKRKTFYVNLSIPLLLLGGTYLIFFWLKRYDYYIFNVIYVNLKGPVRPHTSAAAYVNLILLTFFHYVKCILAPFFLSYDYQIEIPETVTFGAVSGLVFLFAAVYAVLSSKDKYLRFGLGFFIITYIPCSNILPLFNIVADRYMYIPMIGFSCASAVFVRGLFLESPGRIYSESTPKKMKIRPIFMLSIFFIATLFGLSFGRNTLFRDILTLYEHTVIYAPENLRVRYNLAIAYRERGMLKESNRQFEILQGINLQYKTSIVWQMMGENYQLMGEIDKAKKYYSQVLKMRPRRETYANLANIMFREGNIEASRILWEAILDVFPGDEAAIGGLEKITEKSRQNK